jgi:hypothetical protein
MLVWGAFSCVALSISLIFTERAVSAREQVEEA